MSSRSTADAVAGQTWHSRVASKGRLAGLVVLACMAMAGCSNGDTESHDPDPSPLEAYMGRGAVKFDGKDLSITFGRAVDRQSAEEYLQQQRLFEELVAACMADAGFDYISDDLDDLAEEVMEHEEMRAMSAQEYAEQHGYGLSTTSVGVIEVADSPNDAILEGLTAEGVAEWEHALYGHGPHDEGCLEQAAEQQGADETIEAVTEFEDLAEDLRVLRQRLLDHPKLGEARRAWSECMAEAGYTGYADLDGPETEVFERLLELEGWEGEGDIVGEFEGDLPQIDEAELRELQEYEVGVAVADVGCRRAHVEQIAQAVQSEVETEFVDEHRDELERYRTFINAG